MMLRKLELVASYHLNCIDTINNAKDAAPKVIFNDDYWKQFRDEEEVMLDQLFEDHMGIAHSCTPECPYFQDENRE